MSTDEWYRIAAEALLNRRIADMLCSDCDGEEDAYDQG